MEGWIKLHRKSLDHWLYKEGRPHTKREAWEDLLLLCNHDDKKVLIINELIECKRGQSLMSLKSWAKQFKWTIQNVRTFFKLLKNDSMIVVEGLGKSTRVTICNYDIYQENQQASNKQTTNKQQTSNKQVTTNKNDKDIFYNTQILENKEKDFIDKYELIVNFMFGKIKDTIILKPLLKLDDQLTYKEFVNLYAKCNEKNIKLSDIFLEMYNWKPLKTKKTIYRTALTFIKNAK